MLVLKTLEDRKLYVTSPYSRNTNTHTHTDKLSFSLESVQKEVKDNIMI